MPDRLQIHAVIFVAQKVADTPDVPPRHARTKGFRHFTQPNSRLADLLQVSFDSRDAQRILTKTIERNAGDELFYPTYRIQNVMKRLVGGSRRQARPHGRSCSARFSSGDR